MKTRLAFFLVIPLFLLPSAVCMAQQTYSYRLPESNEPIYGTWVNEQYAGDHYWTAQRLVYLNWGYRMVYNTLADESSSFETTYTLVEKWKDAKGNTMYKELLQGRGVKLYELLSISKDGNTLELVQGAGFPKESDLDRNNSSYKIFHRQ